MVRMLDLWDYEAEGATYLVLEPCGMDMQVHTAQHCIIPEVMRLWQRYFEQQSSRALTPEQVALIPLPTR